MVKVYLAIPKALDEQLGYVHEDGKVFRSKIGLDEHVGHVDLSNGKVYAEQFGPDKEVGHVDMKNGKVFLSRFGPDQYVGTVNGDGRMRRHIPLAVDEYIGKVDRFLSFAHSAAGFLLLVLPTHEERNKPKENIDSTEKTDSSPKTK
jgi:hypothetical protein